MTKILAINGSYRDDGVTDETVELLIQELISATQRLRVFIYVIIHSSFALTAESVLNKQVKPRVSAC